MNLMINTRINNIDNPNNSTVFDFDYLNLSHLFYSFFFLLIQNLISNLFGLLLLLTKNLAGCDSEIERFQVECVE